MNNLFGLLLMVLLVSCSDSGAPPDNASRSDTAVYSYSKQLEDTQSFHSSDPSSKISGNYSGTLPCASCEGIETRLTLYDDGSFMLNETYTGGEESSFSNKGKYEVNNNTLYLHMDGAGADRAVMYRISPNSLTQLDMNGKEILGDMANLYVLTKN